MALVINSSFDFLSYSSYDTNFISQHSPIGFFNRALPLMHSVPISNSLPLPLLVLIICNNSSLLLHQPRDFFLLHKASLNNSGQYFPPKFSSNLYFHFIDDILILPIKWASHSSVLNCSIYFCFVSLARF